MNLKYIFVKFISCLSEPSFIVCLIYIYRLDDDLTILDIVFLYSCILIIILDSIFTAFPSIFESNKD